MRHAVLNVLKKQPSTWYVILAFAFSWPIELSLVASKQGWIVFPIPPAIHYVEHQLS